MVKGSLSMRVPNLVGLSGRFRARVRVRIQVRVRVSVRARVRVRWWG